MYELSFLLRQNVKPDHYVLLVDLATMLGLRCFYDPTACYYCHPCSEWAKLSGFKSLLNENDLLASVIPMRTWRIATEDEIKQGRTTDVYFERTVEILKAENLNPIVHAEFTTSGFPAGMDWGVVAGVNDVLKLLEGKEVDVYGLEEGTLFFPRSASGIRTPILSIEGPYQEFAVYETPVLGFLCHTSGMVSRTAHLRIACGEKTLLSFGARRTHPAITPQVEYAAYIGGCDGVSCVLGADLLGIPASGTMPHALIISFQDHVKAWKAYDTTMPPDIPRIALTDTYLDEVREAILAAENVEGLYGVRLDTTSSRRGNFKDIIREVRWELDVRGHRHVRIFISGGLNLDSIAELSIPEVDGFGVGGAISNSPSVDFAMDIVALKKADEWIPVAKRGKLSGRKHVWRCAKCLKMETTLFASKPPTCNTCNVKMQDATVKLIENGEVLHRPKSPKEIRANVLEQLEIIKSRKVV